MREGQGWLQLVLCSAEEAYRGSHHMVDRGHSGPRCGSYQEKPSCEIVLRVESTEVKCSPVSAKKLRNCKMHIIIQTREELNALPPSHYQKKFQLTT